MVRSRMQKNIYHIMVLALLMVFFTMCVLPFKASAELDLPVRNISTGLDYPTIQDAIDAPQTLDGHIIRVDAGTYYENVVLNKSVSLIGEDKFNTVIDGNYTEDVIKIFADKVNITGFTIQNSAPPHTYDNCTWIYDGIWIKQANHCNISDNIIIRNGEGIYLEDSNDNIVYNNNFSSNEFYGIHLYRSANNKLLDNNVSRTMLLESHTTFSKCPNGIGIRLRCSSNFNTLLRNTVFSNSKEGIWLGYCFSNTISNNTVSNNTDGIYVRTMSVYNSLSGNSIFSNREKGIHFVSSLDNVVSGNDIFSNGKDGIYLCSSTRNLLSGNIVSSNGEHGIYISTSALNVVRNNIISDNSKGFLLDYSVSSTISGNNVSLNKAYGIKLFGAGSITLSGNTAFSNEDDGILVHTSDDNMLSDNIVLNNEYGIHIHLGSNNILRDNMVSNNSRGIFLHCESISNEIFYNKFVDNTYHVFLGANSYLNKWDNGAEGNYWSDYTGVDLYSGRYQNITGSDGIGDTPYVIDSEQNIRDNYPLMEPPSLTRIFDIKWLEETYKVVTVSNSTIASLNFSQTDKQISFRTTGPSDTTGFCNVTVPKELLNVDSPDQWIVTVNSQTVRPKVAENATYAFIYFTFTHSTHKVSIKGTKPIDKRNPVANAGLNQTVYEEATVTFNGSASFDNIRIESYTWTFVDETPQTLTGVSPTYTFTSPGTYSITLNVTDIRGNWDTGTMTVTVMPVPVWTQWWFWAMMLLVPTTSGISYLVFRHGRKEGIFEQLQKLARKFVWGEISEEVFEKTVKELKEGSDVDTRKRIDEYLPPIITFEQGLRTRKEMRKR